MERTVKYWMSTLAVCGVFICSVTATAATVHWTATGRVTRSTLSDEFVSSYLPELVGVARGDEVVLNLSFDTDATLSGEIPWEAGGTTYLYDNTPVVLELSIAGRGTHVFGGNEPLPPDIATTEGVSLDDNVYRYLLEPELPVDAITVGRGYSTVFNFTVFYLWAVFGSTNTTIFNGPGLPSTPHPDLTQDLAQLTLVEEAQPQQGLLGIAFRDLFATPSEVPEPGTLAMLGLGLAGLAVSRRRSVTPSQFPDRRA